MDRVHSCFYLVTRTEVFDTTSSSTGRRSYTYLQMGREREGHWVALLPGLEAQAARGLYSRPVSVRRKAARRR